MKDTKQTRITSDSVAYHEAVLHAAEKQEEKEWRWLEGAYDQMSRMDAGVIGVCIGIIIGFVLERIY